MAKSGCVALLLIGIVASVMVQCSMAQTIHVVGDSLGWMIPANTDVYDNWGDNKTFRVGDTLTFNFATNNHDVVEVTEASYDACTSTNIIGSIITTGPANITLTSIGDHYYICTIGNGRHCQSGQKLDITVIAAAPGTTTAPPPPPSQTPTPSQSPSTNGSSTTPPTATPPSSSSVVLGSVFVTFVSIAMGVFF